ncbi:Vacuolar protein sorting-associated protein ist1, partial [Coemansia sp. 'formosensis']
MVVQYGSNDGRCVAGTRRTFQLPWIKFFLSHAPEQPVTLNGKSRMPSWYDIKSLYRIASNKDEAGMNTSMLKINKFIKSEIDSGIPAGRIILGGFSQGDAMTLFAGLQSEYRLSGLAMLSSYLPIRNHSLKRVTDASKSASIFQVHGTADEVVLFQYDEMTSKALEESGYNVDFRPYNVDFRSYNHMVELKLAISRLKLLQAKKSSLNLKARREIAPLLEAGKIESATIRVENIIREDLNVEALEMAELYCELLIARAGLIDQSRTVDPGVSEAVHSLIYASARVEVRELAMLRDMLTAKYGKELVREAMDNAAGLANEKLVRKLSADTPPDSLIKMYLTEIASFYH